MRRRWRGTRALGAGVMAVMALGGVHAVAAADDASPPEAVALEWNHDPGSPGGPFRWGDLDPAWSTCRDGSAQSPVALRRSAEPADLPPLRMTYATVPLVVENTGHTVEVPQPAEGGGTLQVGADRYTLRQWHVHAPSEHVLQGRRADLEIHLVHEDADGRLAVVAVLADDVRRPGGRQARDRDARGRAATPAHVIDAVLSRAPDGPGETEATGVEVSAASVLPVSGRHDRIVHTSRYVAYPGSLTTPPCTQGVRWFVLTQPVRVFADSVATLHDVVAAFPGYDGYPDNNRPLQPLGGREVERPR